MTRVRRWMARPVGGRLWFVGVAVAWASGCGADPAITVEANPIRRELEQSVRTIASDQPLSLRYNPGLCDCAVFELEIPPPVPDTPTRWLRADVTAAEPDDLAGWLAMLAASPVESLPIVIRAVGRVDSDLARSAQGDYVVRVEISKAIEPLPPAPALPGPPAPDAAASP